MNSPQWPYVVEAMRLEDVPTVSAIEKLVFSRPWPTEAYDYELLENPRAHYLVARLKQAPAAKPRKGVRALLQRALSGPELDSSLLGYGGLWLAADEAHISTLAVRTEWQGKGIGELLLASLIEKAHALGASYVTLEVRVSNYRAQRLYTKYGFREVGVRRRYYTDNNEDALIMSTDEITTPEYQAMFQERVASLDAKLTAQGKALSPPSEQAPATTPADEEKKL